MKKPKSSPKRARRRPGTQKPSDRPAAPTRAAAPQGRPVSAAMSRAVVDVQDIGRDLGSASRTIAKGTLRLVYDVGALVGLAGKNVIDGTATLAGSFVRGAEGLVGSPLRDARKPPAVARSRRSTARSVEPGASSTG